VVAKMYSPQFQSPIPVTGLPQPAAQPMAPQKPQVGKTEFQTLLEQKTADVGGALSFSSHAAKRLEQRSINLSPDDIQRISGAVDRAADKGARESLVILNNLAFVISVDNRKVITAMDTDAMKENVITHIDSAIIA
jgi:flagellar operon protein